MNSFKDSFIYAMLVALLWSAVALAAIGGLIWLLIAATSGPTREVPKESCTYTPTGRTDVQTTQQCAGFDSKGQCSMWTPVTTEYAEVTTVCTFKEWK